MATLAKTTFWTRRILIFIGLFFVVVLLTQCIANFMTGRDNVEPLIYEEATNGFGDLPDLKLESLPLKQGSTPTYGLETSTGKLPAFPGIVNVYQFEPPRERLLENERAAGVASSIGFGGASQKDPADSDVLIWTNGIKTFKYNKRTKNMLMTTNLKKDTLAHQSHEISDDLTIYKRSAVKFFESLGTTTSDFVNGSQSAEFLYLDERDQFRRASASSRADFVRVDLFRNVESVSVTIPKGLSKDEEAQLRSMIVTNRVLPQDPTRGSISIILGSNKTSLENIYEIRSVNWEIRYNRVETYDLRQVSEAWADVQEEKGYLRYLVKKDGDPNLAYTPLDVDKFLIYDVELAYYDSYEQQSYLQPIYVFSGEATISPEGKADFYIYAPAVKE